MSGEERARDERLDERDQAAQSGEERATDERGPEAPVVILLAAVGENGVIGRDGGLPWHLPGDLPHVKATTLGHVVVMGRKTYDSIGRPLPGRTTIVVTRDPAWAAAGVTACGDIESALRVAAESHAEIYVLGGAEIYRLAMPYAHRLLISEVPQAPDGDTYFPEIDPQSWVESDRDPREGFDVVTYVRR